MAIEATHDLPAKLHLGCGEDYRDGYHNVDVVAGIDPDEVVNLDETPWPWPAESFTEIRAEHVFEHLEDVVATLRECERVLEPGGRLVMVWPMGVNAIADPDHKHEWTWQTPAFYCGKRHWDVDVGLEVADRRVSLHSHDRPRALALLHQIIWRVKLNRYGAGEWCFGLPSMSGEFTVVMEK